MCIDIALAMFSTLASEGIAFSAGMFRTLKVTYQRMAMEIVRSYEDDASINGLLFDRHSEILAVESFTAGLDHAGQSFLADPMGIPPIPSWARITAAFPGIHDEIRQIVDEANPSRRS